MKPIIITAANGQKRRLSPMGVIGWRSAHVPANDPRQPNLVYNGTMVILADGSFVGIIESEAEFDRLFEAATAGAYGLPTNAGPIQSHTTKDIEPALEETLP